MIEDSVTTHKNNWILIKDSVYVLNIFIVCSEVDWENWDSAEFYDTAEHLHKETLHNESSINQIKFHVQT